MVSRLERARPLPVVRSPGPQRARPSLAELELPPVPLHGPLGSPPRGRRSAVDVRALPSEGPLGPIPDPLPLRDHRKRDGSVVCKRQDGVLFEGGVPRSDDGQQGEVGDCWGLGTALAAAEHRPELVKSLFVATDDPRVFRVRLWDREGDDGEPFQRELEIDTDFWMSGEGAPLYAAGRELESGEGRVLWLMLLEKALVELHRKQGKGAKAGSYTSIDGGWEANMLFHLTGRDPSRTVFNTDRPADAPPEGEAEKAARLAKVADRAWKRLTAGLADGAIPVAGTPGEAGQEIDPELNALGLCGGHLYGILGAFEQDGVRMLRLVNPWRSFEPGDTDPESDSPTPEDGVEDGVFEKPLEWVVEHFADMHIGKASD